MRHTLNKLVFCGIGLSIAWTAVKAVEPTPRPVMRFARFQVGEKTAYGIVERDRVRQINGDLFGEWSKTERTHALSDVTLLVPTQPTKVLALAVNYRSHAGTQPVSPHPEAFFKPPSCLVATGEPIVIPPGTKEVHPEGELVIVISKRAKNVPEDKALDYVLGVTCGNDVSARDWQQNDKQWWRAKGADTFGPCGPFILAGANYDDLLLETRVNGQTRQKERTSMMVHGVAAAVSFISRAVTLEPGDLIYTGTSGTTAGIKPGDVVEVEIEGVGILRNPVVEAQ
jgi:2-keto-4-pentenoate hydratase/2-oxohepta-3-ene-1,7-dioic acid hydratase in catechol pathway